MRDGVRWHDKAPVTAHDMKFTMDLRQHPDVFWTSPGSYEVEVLDRLTYRITCSKRGGLFGMGAISPSIPCWPRHLLEKLNPKEMDNWDFWLHPVGCGPYRHVRTLRGAMMEFEANPDYFRAQPKIKKVILRFGGGNVVPELLSGNVDVVEYQKSTDTLRLSRDGRFRVYQQEWPSGQALWWNHRHWLFQDPEVRRALTHAINRRELLQLLNLEDEIRPKDWLCTVRQHLRGGFPEAIRYDPELAKRLLDQRGWSIPTGNKVRERNGQPFRFKSLVQTNADNVGAAVYVQDQLRRLGVQMDIITMTDFSLVDSRIRNGEFEAAILVLGGNAESLLPAIGYNNPSLFELFKKRKDFFNPDNDILVEEFVQVLRDEYSLFQRDVPATMLYPFTWTTVASARIRGLEQRRYRWDLNQCMDELWLAEEA
jgi:peptide/nickel transport system substrate-binding protein